MKPSHFFFLAYFTPSVLMSVNHHWKLDMYWDGLVDGVLYSSVKRRSRTSLLWCPVFMTCIITPPILVQPVLDLGANISWKRHLLITVWIVFYLLKIDLYLDTLDQLAILCFLDRFSKFPDGEGITHFWAMCFILHWHSNLTLTASCCLYINAVDECKRLVIFN